MRAAPHPRLPVTSRLTRQVAAITASCVAAKRWRGPAVACASRRATMPAAVSGSMRSRTCCMRGPHGGMMGCRGVVIRVSGRQGRIQRAWLGEPLWGWEGRSMQGQREAERKTDREADGQADRKSLRWTNKMGRHTSIPGGNAQMHAHLMTLRGSCRAHGSACACGACGRQSLTSRAPLEPVTNAAPAFTGMGSRTGASRWRAELMCT